MKISTYILSICVVLGTLTSSGFALRENGTGPKNISSSSSVYQQTKKETVQKEVYVCPMHKEVKQDKPGKCSKCGMNLVKKEALKEPYSCSMHPEVKQEKSGKCPKCGMNLVKK